jgi:hypothetical protein
MQVEEDAAGFRLARLSIVPDVRALGVLIDANV